MSKELSNDLTQQIIEMYQDNFTIRKIGLTLHISAHTIRETLVNNNIEIRKRGLQNNAKANKDVIIKEYLNGSSIKSLSLKFSTNDLTIKNLLNDNNTRIRGLSESIRRISVDESFFEVIDTEEKAYVLGFLYADGSVSEYKYANGSTANNVKLNLVETDKQVLEKISSAMGYEGTLSYIKPRADRYSSKGQFSLLISSKKMVNDLINLGIKNKHKIPNIPNHLLRHFIRGVFDGDGCISIKDNGKDRNYSVELFMMGEELFLNQVRDILSQIGVNFSIPKFTRNIYKMRKSNIKETLKLMEYMYEGSTIYLDRKHFKFAVLSQNYRRLKIIRTELSGEGLTS